MSSDRKGLQLKYSSGIAPLITAREYTELIANYKKTGKFPHILNLGGMAIDDSQNRNKWRIAKEDLQGIADQLKGAPLMKNHDIENVDAIIGKVEDAWVEANDGHTRVMWKGETCDDSLIQKILLGYVKNNSIQIAVPGSLCDNCFSKLGKSEEEAALTNIEEPCPRCGSMEMLIRKPVVLEQSMVAIPAYDQAEVTPFGFKASLDRALTKRFIPKEAPKPAKVVKKAQRDPIPALLAAAETVVGTTLAVAALVVKRAEMAMEEAAGETKGGDEALENFPLVEKKGTRKGEARTVEYDYNRIRELSQKDKLTPYEQGELQALKEKLYPGSEEPDALTEETTFAGIGETCPSCGEATGVEAGEDIMCVNCGYHWPEEAEPRYEDEVAEVYCPDCDFHTPDDEAFKAHTLEVHGWDAEDPASWGAIEKVEDFDPEYGWCKLHNKPWESHNQMDLAQDEEAEDV
jgi:Zn finger protein HypA/HybF involved in hydrogenase expression